jgi:hypothetical protein
MVAIPKLKKFSNPTSPSKRKKPGPSWVLV